MIDPDMLFLRPITGVFEPGGYLTSPDWGPGEHWPRVEKGKPAGQQYGLGTHWLHFKREYICGPDSPCAQTTAKDAQKHYPVGPPYLLHVDDLKPVRAGTPWKGGGGSASWAALSPASEDMRLYFSSLFSGPLNSNLLVCT